MKYFLPLVATLGMSCSLFATANYEYDKDEYVIVANGASPDGKYAIVAHGSGDMGYDNFSLYLVNLATSEAMKMIGTVGLDTDANAFLAVWNKDHVKIIRRIDRHEWAITEFKIANSKPVLILCREPSPDEEEEWKKSSAGTATTRLSADTPSVPRYSGNKVIHPSKVE